MDKDHGRKRRQLIVKERKIATDEFMAASIGDCEWLDQSLRDGRISSKFDKNGLAPIHLAAMHGRLDCLKLLVEKFEVDVNLASETGWHPLHLSINKDSGPNALLCMNYLLEKGADVHCVNNENVTVVHQAATEGLMDCLQVLLNKHAPVKTCDIRGHTACDLAKLWGHKLCARVIQNEVWKREKSSEQNEKKKLKQLKDTYGNLQKEALQLLHNEQEFYGSVTFGNWLEEKGFVDSPASANTYNTERHPDMIMKGLAKRLLISGGIDDCATRMEKLSTGKQVAQRPKPSRRKTLKGGDVPKTESKIAAENASKIKKEPKPVEDLEVKNIDLENVLPCLEPEKPLWNFSTNVNSEPVTNIKNMEKLSLSIYPDEEYIPILPSTANLSVKLESEKNKPVAIKVLLPGGGVENAGIYIPSLSSQEIRQALDGNKSERIKVPQEFKSVHIYDVKHKGRPKSVAPSEVNMHFKMF